MAQALRVISGESSTIAVSITGIEDVQSVSGFVDGTEHNLVLTNGVWLLKLSSQQNHREVASNEYFSICLNSTSLGIRKLDKALQIAYTISNATTVTEDVSNHIDVTIPVTYEAITDDLTIEPILQTIYSTASLTADEIEAKLDEKYSSTVWRDSNSGASAYDIAVSNGFVGTEAEWLASLVGPAGADGVDGAGGGSSNPNVFIPTQASDFTSPSAANAGKTWEIQSDIDLVDADFDMSSIPDVILSFKGGSITTTGTITGNNTDIKGEKETATYIHDATIAGTWKVKSVSAHWFGIKTHAESALFDNKPLFKKALYTGCNSGHCDVNVYNIGSFYYVSTDDYVLKEDQNVNLGIFNTTHVHFKGHNFPIIKALDDEVSNRNQIIQLFRAPYCTVEGFEIIGDKDTSANLPEHKFGITFGNDSHYAQITGNKIHGFSGDGIYHLTKYYSGYVRNQTDADFDVGSIDPATGALVPGDTHLMSSNYFLDISTALFQDKGYLYVPGKVNVNNFKIAYYDEVQSFIDKTGYCEFYDRIYFPSNARYIKLEIGYEATLDTSRPISVQSFELPMHVNIEDNEIYDCMRQGISNAPHHSRIIGNEIHDIYGQSSGPCAGIDLEDGTYYVAHVLIENNTFYNNAGSHLLLKYNRLITVCNNHFIDKGVVKNLVDTYYSDFSMGLSASYSEGTKVYGNEFIGRSITVGRGVDCFDNLVKNTTILLRKTYCQYHDNNHMNVRITSGDESFEYPGRPQFYNNNFVWDRSYVLDEDSSPMSQLGRFDEKNNTFDFKNHSDDESRDLWYLGAVSNADAHTGYIDGLVIRGYKGRSSDGMSSSLVNVKNADLSCPFYEKNLVNTPKDIVYKDCKFKEFMYLDFRTYNTTAFPDPADYHTIILDGVHITKEDANIVAVILNMYNTGTNGAFNLIVRNSIFEAKVTQSVNFFDFDNLGTVTVENSKFKSINAKVYNFTSAKCGKVIMRNNEFENITLTKRANDFFENNIFDGVVKSEYPVYADNTAATTGGLAIGEKYQKATGEIMIVV